MSGGKTALIGDNPSIPGVSAQDLEGLRQGFAAAFDDLDQVWLFGSRVTGKHAPYSDLDVAIPKSRYYNSPQESALRAQLDQSPLPFAVDFWHLETAPAFVHAQLRQTGVALPLRRRHSLHPRKETL